mmetsp:Transcript_56164/g.130780  ORF Transcript_56164/g.130780 Transcript_56164/m.130780 type:complete len:346 (+) Transcript_56164:91-1128(+)|eukprot:CAMPEP_0171109382 /NCGR_PEP_ID=MMETSP0766_2-20121228/70744_1 /TAXON_ID=439317 /ORGANISM="Gambierdiscus australes, Strain CAWD 149" /LENGTH=345 /DNA_ID=CAMNT_0011571113 /DNA_START=77 /DNA_END=1114 /DNA_ORIENTATION=+
MVATEEVTVSEAARRAVLAAEEANNAVEADPNIPQAVRILTARVLQETQTVLTTAASSPKRRQSFAEFTSMLSEEVKDVAEDTMAEGFEYAERSLRKAKSVIEDHFHVDEAFRMLGPLRQDSNLARDVHDWFNLVALLPVIVLNFMNWRCVSKPFCGVLAGAITQLWAGKAFLAFWWTTFTYFVVDMLFVLLLPQCVKSPSIIVKHHMATIGYIMIPKMRPEYGWLMGSCLIVEVNTWFLIARRYFNRNGDKMFTPGVPLVKSLRLLLVSSCFYVSWFVIRLGFYPYLLFVIVGEWYAESIRVGTPINLIAITPVMQCIFIFLNVKWSVDLIRSKLKGRGPAKGL